MNPSYWGEHGGMTVRVPITQKPGAHETVLDRADSFLRTLAEIRALPELDGPAALLAAVAAEAEMLNRMLAASWCETEDSHRYDHDHHDCGEAAA